MYKVKNVHYCLSLEQTRVNLNNFIIFIFVLNIIISLITIPLTILDTFRNVTFGLFSKLKIFEINKDMNKSVECFAIFRSVIAPNLHL